ncbi:MAG: YceI family protein [Rudaea sp.]
MGIVRGHRHFAAMLLCAASFAASAATQDFRFDTVHTQILFCASHLRFSNPCGLLRVKSGFIRFDDDDWSTAKVAVLIDMASVDMGDAAWSNKLRSHEFLASERYPTAHFVSSSVTKTDARSGIVHGALTLLGVSRVIDLQMTFNRAGVDPYTFKYTAGFSATARLKRSDFGMRKYLPDIGNDIDIRIEVEGLRDSNALEQADPGAAGPADVNNAGSKEH